jgi:hypothetical protein
MSRCYLVQMPTAEARHLAGVGRPGPASGPSTGPANRSCGDGDREPGLTGLPAAGQPARGPFAPDQYGIVPPGRVEYLGTGTVRLDEDAISSLAGLGAGTDFRVIFADSGPVLLVGADRYPATES